MKKYLFALALALLVIGLGTSYTVSAKTLRSSKKSVTVAKGSSKTVKITYTKTGDVYWDSYNSSIATASWKGGWNGDVTKLKIKGKKVGRTSIVITNSKNNDRVVIKVKVKKKGSSKKSKIRKALNIPKKATCKIRISKKFYWSGGGIYMRHVEVNGTGRYKGYFAMADFTTDFRDTKSEFMWSRL